MKTRTFLLRAALGATLGAGALASAQAAPVYSLSSPSGYVFKLFDSYTLTGNAGVSSTTVKNVYAAPAGLAPGAKYLYASPTDGAITVNNIGASSFSFLWGSPDAENSVAYHTSLGDFVYTGVMLASLGMSTNGTLADSTVFTASLGNTGTIDSVTFTSTKIAFEVDGVSKVPEPSGIALVGAALGALAWTGRRKA